MIEHSTAATKYDTYLLSKESFKSILVYHVSYAIFPCLSYYHGKDQMFTSGNVILNCLEISKE